MSNESDWRIVGPAAVCWALGRRLPPVADVFISGARPDRDRIISMLGQKDALQLRYTMDKVDPVVSLDSVCIIPAGSKLQLVDPSLTIENRRVTILNHCLTLFESLRLRYMATLFWDFTWPEYLIKKLDCDFSYARVAMTEDVPLQTFLMNLDHDFGRQSADDTV